MSDLGNKKVFAKNLSYYMSKYNVDRQALCNALGFKYSTVSEWLAANKYPRIDKIEMLANYFNIQKSDLIEEQESKSSQNPLGDSLTILDGKIRKIPLFESVAAGFGCCANNQIIDYIPLMIDSDAEADETICIKVSGNSMYPKIEDGDIIAVHKQPSIDSGKIGVFLIDNEDGVVKKANYVYDEDWLELLSFNPEYMPRRFEGPDVERVKTLGLVKQIIKMI